MANFFISKADSLEFSLAIVAFLGQGEGIGLNPQNITNAYICWNSLPLISKTKQKYFDASSKFIFTWLPYSYRIVYFSLFLRSLLKNFLWLLTKKELP